MVCGYRYFEHFGFLIKINKIFQMKYRAEIRCSCTVAMYSTYSDMECTVVGGSYPLILKLHSMYSGCSDSCTSL